MSLTKYNLGELIEISTERNYNLIYDISHVKGISIQKSFIETKANMSNVSLRPYYLVKPDYFTYVTVTSRNGEKITIAHNNTKSTYLISPSYIVFKIKHTDILLSDYLFMYFNRSEFDRYARFNSWGSAREIFSWNDMCDIELSLPSIDIQQKYVNIYKAMVANQHSYEKGLDDFKFLCDIYVENLQKTLPLKKIKPYIHRIDIRNENNLIKNVMGISTKKEFREPTSKVNKNQLSNYKIVKPEQFCFVQTTHNEKVFAYAYNNTNKDIVISSVNEVFSVNKEILLPEYLCMFFNRTEFDRYARFHSWGSARETFTWDDLINVKIPIADINIQKSISKIYTVYKNRKSINDKLKLQIKKICPILIKGSIEEALK